MFNKRMNCYGIMFLVFFCLKTITGFSQEVIIIGIAGGTGSGKTTLAKKIYQSFPQNAVLIEQDCYYKDLSYISLEDRELVNFDHPQALDFDLLHSHLHLLKQKKCIEKPIYNFKIHCRENLFQEVQPAKFVIVEGILLFTVPQIREMFDLKIFIDAPDDIRLIRRLERDITERGRDVVSVKKQYLTSVRPMHQAFVEPSKAYADVIIPGIGDTTKAVSLIVSKLQDDLRDQINH